ncbi:putative myosin F [Plasmodium gaboni]|uniref:Putative myosin F n=1 Tax=Plasmodium gaboni TaxID=647221 RepID=A0A151LJ71_9APIC|nr:putative myosin F [Plasmodium gaboni]KYN99040.1 putative myosin F [Plasmodium gaboni]
MYKQKSLESRDINYIYENSFVWVHINSIKKKNSLLYREIYEYYKYRNSSFCFFKGSVKRFVSKNEVEIYIFIDDNYNICKDNFNYNIIENVKYLLPIDTNFGCSDNTQLIYLNSPNLLENIYQRYNKAYINKENRNCIYTYIGYILLSVNPYENFDIYDESYMKKIKERNDLFAIPHPFSIANDAYNCLIEDKISQSIIISGESGAGKTESSKQVLKYLTYLSYFQKGYKKRKKKIIPNECANTECDNMKYVDNNMKYMDDTFLCNDKRTGYTTSDNNSPQEENDTIKKGKKIYHYDKHSYSDNNDNIKNNVDKKKKNNNKNKNNINNNNNDNNSKKNIPNINLNSDDYTNIINTYSSSTYEEKIQNSNPLLECFGNAKTIKNDNSSRFGKLMKLNYNEKGILCSASIETYLLAKSRVVDVPKGEGNYHIFYSLCQNEKLSKEFDLLPWYEYNYLIEADKKIKNKHSYNNTYDNIYYKNDNENTNNIIDHKKDRVKRNYETDDNYNLKKHNDRSSENNKKNKKKNDIIDDGNNMNTKYKKNKYKDDDINMFQKNNKKEETEKPSDSIEWKNLYSLDFIIKCFNSIGVLPNEQEEIYKTLICILLLGNINFVESDNDQEPIKIQNIDICKKLSQLLYIKNDNLNINKIIEILTIKKVRETQKSYTYQQAIYNRDVISKILYQLLFEYIILCVNDSLNASDHNIYSESSERDNNFDNQNVLKEDKSFIDMDEKKKKKRKTFRRKTKNLHKQNEYDSDDMDENIIINKKLNFIGILDIYGFENFSNEGMNGFEQLCINYANEILHAFFLKQIIHNEQKIHYEENLRIEKISYNDNSNVISLIGDTKDISIYTILEDLSLLFVSNKSNEDDNKDIFYEKLNKNIINSAKYKNIIRNYKVENKSFIISHYAGDVLYDSADFFNKNVDILTSDIEMFLSGCNYFISENLLKKKRFRNWKYEAIKGEKLMPSKGNYEKITCDVAKQCDDGEKQCDDVEKQCDDGEKQCDDVEKQYDDVEKQYDDVEKQYDGGAKKYDDEAKQYDDVAKQYNDGVKQNNDGDNHYNDKSKKNNKRKLSVKEMISHHEQESKNTISCYNNSSNNNLYKNKVKTIFSSFKKQLEVLSNKLSKTSSKFIRCIKPNQEKQAKLFNKNLVLSQLVMSGMVDILNLMKNGYPCRVLYDDIWIRYSGILQEDMKKYLTPKMFCKIVLMFLEINSNEYTFGKTKIFFRFGVLSIINEILNKNEKKKNTFIQCVYKYWLHIRKRRLLNFVLFGCRFKILFKKRRAKLLMENGLDLYNEYLFKKKLECIEKILFFYFNVYKQRIYFLKLKSSTLIIQKNYRTYILRKKFLYMKKQILFIQDYYLFQKYFKQRVKAANTIRKNWIMYITKYDYKYLLKCIIKIQRAFKKYMKKKYILYCLKIAHVKDTKKKNIYHHAFTKNEIEEKKKIYPLNILKKNSFNVTDRIGSFIYVQTRKHRHTITMGDKFCQPSMNIQNRKKRKTWDAGNNYLISQYSTSSTYSYYNENENIKRQYQNNNSNVNTFNEHINGRKRKNSNIEDKPIISVGNIVKNERNKIKNIQKSTKNINKNKAKNKFRFSNLSICSGTINTDRKNINYKNDMLSLNKNKMKRKTYNHANNRNEFVSSYKREKNKVSNHIKNTIYDRYIQKYKQNHMCPQKEKKKKSIYIRGNYSNISNIYSVYKPTKEEVLEEQYDFDLTDVLIIPEDFHVTQTNIPEPDINLMNNENDILLNHFLDTNLDSKIPLIELKMFKCC